MESLLCDEVWLSSPDQTAVACFDDDDDHREPQNWRRSTGDKEECYEATIMCLHKELSYMPQPGYFDYLLSNNNLMHSRSKAIQWLLKSRSRLNLSFETVFNAANYLDRFLSINPCHGWRHWMIELLSVACLSVASKFIETSAPSLHEIQMDDLDYSFQSNTIKRMELALLQTLGWRLACITTYSYVELLISNLDSTNSQLLDELTSRVTKLLLGSMLDVKLLKYRPSVVAVSALWCTLDEQLIPSSYSHIAYITRPFNQNQKDDVVKCHRIMKSRRVDIDPLSKLRVVLYERQPSYWPSSPVTVLLRERIDIYDCQVDLSIFNNKIIPAAGSNINLESCKKRKK
ncbi:hypothetical protein LWI28_001509 [Acer negundo]|uniref:Cyclin-like domain-containing protein n=1 Tax=Acer negundo TaxID=4023 RepID=A0AAD5ND24_ACENE|nr:hypothetical protein LWI28_001509 [Acer negundo]KAK4833998.1 hypothetical protein QYF36_014724 [Acer negundo]